MENTSPLFKGATRPACLWGIPIKPCVGVIGAVTLLSFWIYLPLIIVLPPLLIAMNKIARDDDQRFLQLYLYIRLNFLGGGNRWYWGSICSFSPVSYKKNVERR